MSTSTATDADRRRDFQQLARALDDAVFDVLAAHRAPAGLYADGAAVRFCVEQVLVDALGRMFSVDLDHDPDRRIRARALALLDVLRRHVLTYGTPSPSPAPSAHPFN